MRIQMKNPWRWGDCHKLYDFDLQCCPRDPHWKKEIPRAMYSRGYKIGWAKKTQNTRHRLFGKREDRKLILDKSYEPIVRRFVIDPWMWD